MSYRVTWEQDAVETLDKLDVNVIQRIIVRINWLAKNLGKIKPHALTGTLKGYFRLRIGSYRVIYSINRREKEIIIEYLGHRKDIYKLH
jgi:mRNA interferase RelE/StbE